MFKAEDMIVLDLTPELGGRVFSFYQAGFRNIYALEKDIDIISRLTKLIDPHRKEKSTKKSYNRNRKLS